jgi:hypothetical protein
MEAFFQERHQHILRVLNREEDELYERASLRGPARVEPGTADGWGGELFYIRLAEDAYDQEKALRALDTLRVPGSGVAVFLVTPEFERGFAEICVKRAIQRLEGRDLPLVLVSYHEPGGFGIRPIWLWTPSVQADRLFNRFRTVNRHMKPGRMP